MCALEHLALLHHPTQHCIRLHFCNVNLPGCRCCCCCCCWYCCA
jgi:hypothetical protein